MMLGTELTWKRLALACAWRNRRSGLKQIRKKEPYHGFETYAGY